MWKKTSIYFVIITFLFFIAYLFFNSYTYIVSKDNLIKQGYQLAVNDLKAVAIESGKSCKPVNLDKDIQLINVKCLEKIMKTTQKVEEKVSKDNK